MATKRTDEPKTAGQRIRKLRLHYGATEDLVASMVGMSRTNVIRLEGDKTKWNGKAPNYFSKGIGMTYEQFERFREGIMPLSDGIALAKAKFEAAIEADRLRYEHTERLAEAITKAREREEIAESTRAVMYDVFDQVGGWDWPISRMVDQVISTHRAIVEHIQRSVRTSRSQRVTPK